MKRKPHAATLLSLAALTALAAGCASTGSADSRAEAQCTYLARAEGLRMHQIDGVRSNAGGVVALNVRVEDAVGRRVPAVCNYNSGTNTATWAQPLPQGLARS